MRIARAEVSPMVPWILPRNRFFTGIEVPSMNPWLLSAARGVACVTASTTAWELLETAKLVIFPAKEIIRKHLPARAGFIKFCPSPPNSCFTTMIAKALPRIGIQIGIWGGMFSASRSPVTTALKSVVVFFLCISRSYSHSKNTLDATVASTTRSACTPKFQIPKSVVGRSAIATSCIIRLVVILSLIWGLDDTLYICSIVIPPPISFSCALQEPFFS